jgi:hypothetical protein
MWGFCGKIDFECEDCGKYGDVDINEFEIEHVYSDERQMGNENAYKLYLEETCRRCKNWLYFEFHVYEYPEGTINYVQKKHENVMSSDEPNIEYYDTYYEVEDFGVAVSTIEDIIFEIKKNPNLIKDITHREFEELIAELFRSKGFDVELTKRTRDGGKDIIAITTDQLGTKLKYFIECKHYAEENKVSVDLVRALYGVKNTRGGPNKVILATTSTFTNDAYKFASEETLSKWEIDLVDYNQILEWIGEYSGRKDDEDTW